MKASPGRPSQPWISRASVAASGASPRSRRATARPRPDRGLQRRHLLAVELLQRLSLDVGQPECLPVQRLLEDRARVTGVAEAFAARGTAEDPLEGVVGARTELVLVLGSQPAGDLEQVGGRVVRERELAREAGAQARVRAQEAAHQARVTGHDHHEPVTEVLHPLEERLDCLGAEVEPAVAAPGRERVRLVDEEDAVERAADGAIGLDRGLADVLADERRAVDLDEVTLLEQAHRAVHLGEQPGDGRLAGARVAEEDEVLARRHLGQLVLLPPRLHLEERDERAHLLLDGLQADQAVELGLQLCQWPRWLYTGAEQILELGTGRPPELVAELTGGVAQVLDRIRRHERDVPAFSVLLARAAAPPPAPRAGRRAPRADFVSDGHSRRLSNARARRRLLRRRRAAGRTGPGSAPAGAAGARRALPRRARRAPSGRPRATRTGRSARRAASARPGVCSPRSISTASSAIWDGTRPSASSRRCRYLATRPPGPLASRTQPRRESLSIAARIVASS